MTKLLPHEYIKLKKIVKLGHEVKHDDECKYCSGNMNNKTLICSSCTDALRFCSDSEKKKLVEEITKAGGEALANSIQRVFHYPSAKDNENRLKLKEKQDKAKGKRLDQHTASLIIDHLILGWSYSRLAEKFNVSKTTIARLKNKTLECDVTFLPM